MNPLFDTLNTEIPMEVRLERVCEAAELDEQWSSVGNKSNQCWLWGVSERHLLRNDYYNAEDGQKDKSGFVYY